MTNEQLFEDLKQFIAATVTQQASDVRGDIAQVKSDLAEVKSDVQRLEKKVDDGFAGVSTIIETINTRIDSLEDDVHVRLTKLERRTA